MGFDPSDLARGSIMAYASAHEILRQIDRQLATIRKPCEGNPITGHYQKIDGFLIEDLDGIRCLDRRAIQEIKRNCLRLNSMIDSNQSMLGDMVRETLRGELPERVRVAKSIQAEIKPQMTRCKIGFFRGLILIIVVFGVGGLYLLRQVLH